MSATRYRRRQLLRRDPTCWFCGLGFPPFPLATDEDRRHAEPTVEHLLPRSKGGSGRWENTVLAHSFCNSLAGDKTPQEKRAIRARLRAATGAEGGSGD